MTNRTDELNFFLEKNGWQVAHRTPLACDASARTYDRLSLNGKTAILMNSPLSERPDLFVFFDSLLARTGIRVPRILAQDLTNGFLLLEDFGDNTFTRLLEKGVDEQALYQQAVDTLIQMQKNIILSGHHIPSYSTERQLKGVMMLPNWFGKYVIPGGLTDSAVLEFQALWQKLLDLLKDVPNTLILLDYHADNLMITPDNACGVLDFQDACFGPVTYDLMSLLEDERRDVSSLVRDNLIEHYFAQRPELNTPLIRDTTAVVAMQRHTRVIGLFVRLFMRDKKEKYLHLIPFIWQLVERHLDQPLFAEYKDWLNRYIPQSLRTLSLKPEDLHD